ncbi:hypothetical protein J2W24_005770 [Variovorax boronicumulans]|uniref:hypothetical protein n=1 Tax=Variovorax boronicumulans TaxID=436515 RepID=UPI000BB301A4|nr:hypothetical protein [Variovorax boronicumulans]MDP9920088.1 hypothetical protein [Variovorax boronicumulans]PBI83337.1 hypothetical protein BKP43_59930 [Variovorax boronicumulans]
MRNVVSSGAANVRRVRGWLGRGWVASAVALVLIGCGGGGGGGGSALPPLVIGGGNPPGATSYVIGGEVAGLSGAVVLQNNGSDDLNLNASGPFKFAKQVPAGNPYAVTVARQPTGQTCAVNGGVGSAAGPVDSVRVVCSHQTFELGGTVSGLTGTVVLQNNDGDDLRLSGSGSFRFASVLPLGSAYRVTVRTQPASQTCTVAQGEGRVEGVVGSVAVTCVNVGPPPVPSVPTGLSVGYDIKTYKFAWNASAGATHYRLFEASLGLFITPKVDNIGSTSYEYQDALLLSRADVVFPPVFGVAACNASGCSAVSSPLQVDLSKAIGYFKAPVSKIGSSFGNRVTLSGDGKVMAAATARTGEVHVFSRAGTNKWRMQATLTAANADIDDEFGASLKLSRDGSVLIVGAPSEASVSGDPSDNSQVGVGAAYVFERSGDNWTQQAYLKGSAHRGNFGRDVSISDDGRTVAVGAPHDVSDVNHGYAYVFQRNGGAWALEARVQAHNRDLGDQFGGAVALSGDGKVLAVGAIGESSGAVGNGADNSALLAGAVYVYGASSGTWTQSAYLKAGTPQAFAFFGNAVALNANGSRLAVGSTGETNAGKNVGGFDPSSPVVQSAGAVFTFTRNADAWPLESYVKASNTHASAVFGSSVALSADGSLLAVGSSGDSADSSGINGNPTPGNTFLSGAVHLYDNRHGSFMHQAFIKAPNVEMADMFGLSVAMSGDGSLLAVGAPREDGGTTGINGNQADNSGPESGAVYLY